MTSLAPPDGRPDDPLEVTDFMPAQGRGDGLPVVPVFDSPRHLQLVVGGGPRTAFLPSFGDQADPEELWI